MSMTTLPNHVQDKPKLQIRAISEENPACAAPKDSYYYALDLRLYFYTIANELA